MVALIAADSVAAFALAGDDPPVLASRSGLSLERTSSGLLTARKFDRAIPNRRLKDSFEFNGDAGAQHSFIRATSAGLKVGVHRQPAHDFKGWFAVTVPAFPATGVYHVRMARPPGNVTGAGREAESVFAVQTASTKVTGLINFVEVTSDSRHGHTAWQVDYSHGKVANATNKLYWRSRPSPHARRSQNVTVRTNGHSTMSAWFGDRVVFNSQHLDMNVTPPFQAYLEVQALRTSYVSTFRDFWVTKSASIPVTGLRPHTRVSLRTFHQRIIATAVADGAGRAVLRLPPPEARGRAALVMTAPGGQTTVLPPFPYAGGDHYHLTRH